MLPKWDGGHDNPQVDAWRHMPTSFADNKAFAIVHKFPGNIQIIEGEQDEIIPHQTVQNYLDAAVDNPKVDYHLMKDWPHSIGNDPKRSAEFQEVLLNWANKVNTEV